MHDRPIRFWTGFPVRTHPSLGLVGNPPCNGPADGGPLRAEERGDGPEAGVRREGHGMERSTLRWFWPLSVLLLCATPAQAQNTSSLGAVSLLSVLTVGARPDPDAFLHDDSIPDDNRKLTQKLAFVGGSCIGDDREIKQIERTLDDYKPGGTLYNAADREVRKLEAELSTLLAGPQTARTRREIALVRESLSTQRDFRDNEMARRIRRRGQLLSGFMTLGVRWKRLKQAAEARNVDMKLFKVKEIEEILKRRTGA
jgi:hypothetical protein